MKKKDIIIGNFLGGLAWGLGTVVGATIVVAILAALLRSAIFVPFVGDITNAVLQTIEQRQNQIQDEFIDR